MLEISFYNHGFITKENFYKFNCKNQKQPPEVFWKKDVLRNFAKFTGKDLCQSLFFHRVVDLRPSKNFLRTTFLVALFLQNTRRLLLKNNCQIFKNLFQIFLIYELLTHSCLFLKKNSTEAVVQRCSV